MTKVAIPERLWRRPQDHRGYVVPWFVAWLDEADNQVRESEGRPEFRVMDRQKWAVALRDRRCWVCGEPLGRWLAFPIGPMCAITRTTSEPPCHVECAEYSVRACPFLSNPEMVRRTEGLPADAGAMAGVALLRNPGVTCLWVTREFELFADDKGKPLLTVGRPERVEWYREGRAATREEVQAAIDSGMPNLLALAKSEGAFAVEALGKQVKLVDAWLPAA